MKALKCLSLGLLVIFGAVSASLLAVETTYYFNDPLATTIGTSDAAGEIAAMEADAFGAPIAAAHAPSRYTGKPYDEDLGAYVFPFRNYRAQEARWMSADPSGFPDGVNGQAYAPIPLVQLDRLGLRVEFWAHSITGTSGGGASPGASGPMHGSFHFIPDNPADFSASTPGWSVNGNNELYTTLSAGPSNGLLVSESLRYSDIQADKNINYGVVTPPPGMSDTDFIQSFIDADAKYNDDLPYGAFATGDKYNSNSYLSGLLQATGAQLPSGVPLARFWGWNKPVPANHFE